MASEVFENFTGYYVSKSGVIAEFMLTKTTKTPGAVITVLVQNSSSFQSPTLRRIKEEGYNKIYAGTRLAGKWPTLKDSTFFIDVNELRQFEQQIIDQNPFSFKVNGSWFSNESRATKRAQFNKFLFFLDTNGNSETTLSNVSLRGTPLWYIDDRLGECKLKIALRALRVNDSYIFRFPDIDNVIHLTGGPMYFPIIKQGQVLFVLVSMEQGDAIKRVLDTGISIADVPGVWFSKSELAQQYLDAKCRSSGREGNGGGGGGKGAGLPTPPSGGGGGGSPFNPVGSTSGFGSPPFPTAPVARQFVPRVPTAPPPPSSGGGGGGGGGGTPTIPLGSPLRTATLFGSPPSIPTAPLAPQEFREEEVLTAYPQGFVLRSPTAPPPPPYSGGLLGMSESEWRENDRRANLGGDGTGIFTTFQVEKGSRVVDTDTDMTGTVQGFQKSLDGIPELVVRLDDGTIARGSKSRFRF